MCVVCLFVCLFTYTFQAESFCDIVKLVPCKVNYSNAKFCFPFYLMLSNSCAAFKDREDQRLGDLCPRSCVDTFSVQVIQLN